MHKGAEFRIVGPQETVKELEQTLRRLSKEVVLHYGPVRQVHLMELVLHVPIAMASHYLYDQCKTTLKEWKRQHRELSITERALSQMSQEKDAEDSSGPA
jgi:hypothetical protein